jgi:phosphocarrier protein HPr
MIKDTFIVKNKSGLHARPATEFSKKAREFMSDITVRKGEKDADAKSMLGILTLALSKNSQFELIISGDDEEVAMIAFRELIEMFEEQDV